MAQWRIKEISNLSGISVRMLHHYDKIGLLKASMRTSSGYRGYSEQAFVTLQQIIALKFFGFSLRQIKTMLQQKLSIQENLHAQQQLLQDQVESLHLALDTLDTILEKYKTSKSLNWKHLIELIERYRMAEEIKNTWAGKLNKKQQERYLAFRQKYPQEVKAWEKTTESINSMQLGNPEGPEGERAVKDFLAFSQAIEMFKNTEKSEKMTEANASDLLKTAYKFTIEGTALSSEGNVWFAKAIIAHRLHSWDELYQTIAKNLKADPEGEVGKKVAQKWRNLIAEHCMGAPEVFTLGIMFIIESANAQVQLTKETKLPTAQHLYDNAKILHDPMALDWILKALKAH